MCVSMCTRVCVRVCVCACVYVRELNLNSGAVSPLLLLFNKLSGSTWKSEAGVTGAAALLFNKSTYMYLPLASEEDKTKEIEHGCE